MFRASEIPVSNIDLYSWTSIATRKSPSDREYLKFAQNDLIDGCTPRHLIAALSNAKRALHLRLEDLAFGFGLSPKTKIRSFPFLMHYLSKCGLATPGILTRGNALRNEVEHDFVFPEFRDVQDLIDVVELFLAATDRWIDRQPDEIQITPGLIDPSGKYELAFLIFRWASAEVILRFTPCNSTVRPIKWKDHVIPSSDSEYFHFIKLAVDNVY